MNDSIILQIVIYFILIGGSIITLYIIYRARLERQRTEWEAQRQYCVLAILVPKNNEKTPLAAEQMLASLHGIFREDSRFQEKISFEIACQDKFIQFYVHTPKHLKEFIEGQIYAQYPTAEIYETPDYIREPEGLNVVAGTLDLIKKDFYPIKTFLNFEVDPLAAITGVLSQVEANERIWIQIIIKPVPDSWQTKGVSYVSSIKGGRPVRSPITSFILGIFEFIIDVLTTASGREVETAAKAEVKLSGPEELALKAIENKATKLGFETKIRMLAMAPDRYRSKSKLDSLTGAFKQFNTTNLNGFMSGKFHYSYESFMDFKERRFGGKGFILNIEELASLFHLPTETVVTPNLVWAGSKKGEPPSNLPIEGVISDQDLTVFGITNFRNMKHRFGIKTRDRRLHLYAMGKTGTGKSTLLENMIIDDIREGRGVAVVDPHGELINHILNFIPDDRINDVIYFNAADREWPIGFNPLEAVDPDLKNIIASGVVGIFKKIFGESWGPRLEYILRNTILALLDYPGATLLEIMRVLVDKDFRKKVIEKIHDPVIRDFFINEYEKYDPKFRTEAIAPIQNKVGQFLSSSTVRNVVGQSKSTFDSREVMDSGKILLLDLSIGKIGEDNAALLGAMMITKIQLSAMQRADTPEEKRRDFYLYVDEFQSFVTDSFAIILSEARKYHLNLILTNQYIAQIPEVVAKAIFGNVGTLLAFRVGATDASFLVKELEPVFEANDLVNLDNYHIYVKMAIDGVTRPAFSAVTLPPLKGESHNRDRIIAASREKYSQQRAIVEDKIKENSSKTDGVSYGTKQFEVPASSQSRRDFLGGKELIGLDYQIIEDTHGEKWYLLNPADGSKTKPDNDKNTPSPKSILGPMIEKQLRKEQQHLIGHDDIKYISKEQLKGNEVLKVGDSVRIK